ncbi:MAG: J domain-containing protein [Candidatus Poribacteria bacterium]|nr:J domain-containing protein [Candidatus Poribacteria bacterium]
MNTTNSMMNPFDVLRVDESASDAEVKKAYFQMVRQFTPEKHAEQFKEIREAYDLLKDPSRRLEAEVFSFAKPAEQAVVEDAELPPVKLDSDVFLTWIRRTRTDLERTDFTSDFNEVL